MKARFQRLQNEAVSTCGVLILRAVDYRVLVAPQATAVSLFPRAGLQH